MTSPVRSFTELPPGSQAPDFTLPSHAGDHFHLSDFRLKEGVLLYFSDGLFHRASNSTNDLFALADRLEDFTKAAVRVVAISRDDYPAAADDCLARYGSGVSLLVDRSADVARLYGCHCQEPQFGASFGYDRGPLLCLIDSSGIIRLRTEVASISSPDPPRQLTVDEIENLQWNCESGFPQNISMEFLLHLAHADFSQSESPNLGVGH